VPGWAVLVSLIVFTLVYGGLAVLEFKLITRAAKEGPPEIEMHDDSGDGEGEPDQQKLATVY
jgi:cytochrome d ubiquinol oxidase subunit I